MHVADRQFERLGAAGPDRDSSSRRGPLCCFPHRYPGAVNVYQIEQFIELVLLVPLLGMKVFALADAAYRKDAFFVAADKQNKAFWLIILVVFLLLQVLIRSPLQMLNLIGTVAAGVYLADVRPTLRAMRHY